MSTLDTPIQNQAVNIDTPVSEVNRFSPDNQSLDTFKAIKAAFLEHYNTGRPVTESFAEQKGAINKDRNLSALAAEKAALDDQAVVDVLDDLALSDPDVFVESIEAAQELRAATEFNVRRTDPTAQFVDSIAGEDATQEQIDNTTAVVKMWELFNEGQAETSTGDYVLDFAANMVPFVSTGREAGLTGAVFGNQENIETAIFNFKSKSPAEQLQMWPALQEEVVDSLGPIRGFDTLRKFLDPTDAENLGDFSNWWKVVDAVDIAAVGTTAAIQIAKAKQSFNVPKVLDSVENKEQAGNAVTVALADEDASTAMNMTQETAFSDAAPFDIDTIDPGYTKNISAESMASIKSFFGRADRTAEDIMVGNGYLKEGVLHTPERAIKEKIAEDTLSSAKHEEIRVVGRTENTTTFEYKAKNDEGDWFEDTYILDLELNDVGQYSQTELKVGGGSVLSPIAALKDEARLDASIAEIMDHQSAKMFRELTNLQREALAPLGNLLAPKGRKKLRQLESVLRKGDEYENANGSRGKLFHPDDPELAGFDDGMLEAYYSTNRLYNNLWRLRNNAKREEMIAFGYKRLGIRGDEEYSFGKPFDTAGDANNSILREKVNNVYDAVEDKVLTRFDSTVLEEQYALGKKLIKLADPYSAGASRGKYTYVLGNADDVTDLPATVINRKVGYVPRISEDGFWFVKEFGDDTINGVPVTGQVVKTHRYFDNKEEALVFRDQLRQKAIDEQGLTEKQAADKYRELEDREQEIVANATGQFSNGSGGFYTGARAEDQILFGLDGDDAKLINPFEALSRNIANISRLVPINQWRLGMEQRWINTANKLLPQSNIEKFGALPREIESTRAGVFLNKMAEQIRDWQGFPSAQEQAYNSVNQRLYEWALRTGRNKTAKLVGWMRDRDPVSGARAAAFHSLLGWFNPAQLWVQAQGMSVASSIALGKNLTSTLKHTAGLAAVGFGENIPKGRYSLAAKVAGMDVDEFTEMHQLWRKTGLEDSILQDANYSAGIKGHGIAMDALTQAADKGLFFYRHGEMLNRRMSFSVALDELKRGEIKGFSNFKKGDTVTDEALKAVLVRSNNLMLNMSKAARANWQKGIASLPTQFFGITAKTLETVGGFNDNLSSSERLRVLAGQVALYGAAGIPLATMGTQYLLDAVGVTQEDIDNNPVAVKTFNDGFWGFVTLGIMGVDAEVSQRGSLLRGVTDFVDNWMFSESTVGEKLLGAFGQTGQRFWDSFTEQMRPLMYNAYPVDAIDIATMPMAPFLDTISTWRNGEKALFMQMTDKILSKRGDTVIEMGGDGFSVRESIAKAIGFTLSDETKNWTIRERNDHVISFRKKVSDIVVNMMNEAVLKSEAGLWDAEKQKALESNYANIIAELDWSDKQAVTDSVRRRLSGKSQLADNIRRHKQLVGTTATDGISGIQALLGGKIQTIDEPEGEE